MLQGYAPEARDIWYHANRNLQRFLAGVEGRRFLLRMLSSSIDLFVEEGDVEAPHFHHSEGPTRKMFADNPDADYLRAPIRLGPGRVYRVWGTRLQVMGARG